LCEHYIIKSVLGGSTAATNASLKAKFVRFSSKANGH